MNREVARIPLYSVYRTDRDDLEYEEEFGEYPPNPYRFLDDDWEFPTIEQDNGNYLIFEETDDSDEHYLVLYKDETNKNPLQIGHIRKGQLQIPKIKVE